MNKRLLILCFAIRLLIVLTIVRGLVATEKEAKSELPLVKNFALSDLHGEKCTLNDWKHHKAVVVVFLGTECPVSNAYLPAITRMAEAYKSKGVGVYGVYPAPELTTAGASKHATEYELKVSRLLLDPRQDLASKMGVGIMPMSVVVSPTGQVLYRGRIDNRWSLDGRRRIKASKYDLKDAVDAVLAGRRPDPEATKAFGCPLPEPIAKDN